MVMSPKGRESLFFWKTSLPCHAVNDMRFFLILTLKRNLFPIGNKVPYAHGTPDSPCPTVAKLNDKR
jgi:hypothetical protein